MKIKLEKWYLDITSKQALGFYYIMCLSIGPIRIGFSGINHFDSSGKLKSFRFSRVKIRSFHSMSLKTAQLFTSISSASLNIDHGHSQIKGTWNFLAPPQKRMNKPFYKSELGWCDWKVWTPKAAVNLEIRKNGTAEEIKGTGYIDYVRFNLCPWKIPIRRLYWGRMHNQDSWGVFISLEAVNKTISLYMNPEAVEKNISVCLNRDNCNKAINFVWDLGSPLNYSLYKCEIIRLLENEEILGKGRLLNIIPSCLRKKIGSSGRDEKYETRSVHKGKESYGIMEEVIWNA